MTVYTKLFTPSLLQAPFCSLVSQLDPGGNATDAVSRSALVILASQHLTALSTYQHRHDRLKRLQTKKGWTCVQPLWFLRVGAS